MNNILIKSLFGKKIKVNEYHHIIINGYISTYNLEPDEYIAYTLYQSKYTKAYSFSPRRFEVSIDKFLELKYVKDYIKLQFKNKLDLLLNNG